MVETLESDIEAIEEEIAVIEKTGDTLYVDNSSTETKENGTQFYPYKTIQSAITTAKFGDIIRICPGEYTESLTIANKPNISILSVGVIGSYRTKIDGDITISGSTTALGISNLEFSGNFINSSVGTMYIDNCQFNNVSVSATGYTRFDFCFIEGTLTHTGNNSFDLFNCIFDSNNGRVVCSPAAFDKHRLYFQDCQLVTIATHTSGNIVSDGSTTFFTSTQQSDAAIKSTCAAGSGSLLLLNGSVFNGATYSPIQKTGDCPYTMGKFLYEPQNSTFSGTMIDSGLHAQNIYTHTARTNYTRIADTVEANLYGIDLEFGSVKTSIANTNNTVATLLTPDENGVYVPKTKVASLPATVVNGGFVFLEDGTVHLGVSDAWVQLGV